MPAPEDELLLVASTLLPQAGGSPQRFKLLIKRLDVTDFAGPGMSGSPDPTFSVHFWQPPALQGEQLVIKRLDQPRCAPHCKLHPHKAHIHNLSTFAWAAALLPGRAHRQAEQAAGGGGGSGRPCSCTLSSPLV